LSKKIPLVLFLMVCILDLVGVYFEHNTIIFMAKPFLMITLIWYYIVNTKTVNKLFVAGLFFSFLGDVLLLGTGELYFILGLLFFLIAHVFYIIMVIKLLKNTKMTQVLLASIPYLIIFTSLLTILYSGLGEMKIPVIVYAITITVLGISSLSLYLQNKNKTHLILVFGVLIFIISDSVLALNMFYKEQSIYPLLIISTYVIAQYLICRFVLLNEIKNIKINGDS